MVLIRLVDSLFNIYELILVARVLMSWIPTLDPTHPVVSFVYNVTEPVLRPIRNLMPAGLMIDFSPMIVFLFLPLVKSIVIIFLQSLLRGLGGF